MILHVNAIEAAEVPRMDFGNNPSDPYLLFSLSTSNQTWKTKHINNTETPVWNQKFDIPITTELTDELTVKLFDHDVFSRDDHISTYIFKVREFPVGKVIDNWYAFKKTNEAPSGGRVRLSFHLDRPGQPAFVNH